MRSTSQMPGDATTLPYQFVEQLLQSVRLSLILSFLLSLCLSIISGITGDAKLATAQSRRLNAAEQAERTGVTEQEQQGGRSSQDTQERSPAPSEQSGHSDTWIKCANEGVFCREWTGRPGVTEQEQRGGQSNQDIKRPSPLREQTRTRAKALSDLPQREPTVATPATQSDTLPPFRLVPGELLPGWLSFPRITGHLQGSPGNVMAPTIQIGMTSSNNFEYEIRPKGAEELKLRVKAESFLFQSPSGTVSSFESKGVKFQSSNQDFFWVEQPYEVFNKNGQVVYSYSPAESPPTTPSRSSAVPNEVQSSGAEAGMAAVESIPAQPAQRAVNLAVAPKKDLGMISADPSFLLICLLGMVTLVLFVWGVWLLRSERKPGVEGQDVQALATTNLLQRGTQAPNATNSLTEILARTNSQTLDQTVLEIASLSSTHVGGVNRGKLLNRLFGLPSQPNTIPALMEMATGSYSPADRKTACHALARCKATEAVSVLLNAFLENDKDIQFEAGRALASIGSIPDTAIPLLTQRLATLGPPFHGIANIKIAEIIMDILASCGPRAAAAMPILTRILELQGDDQSNLWADHAAKVLAFIGPSANSAAPLLISAVKRMQEFNARAYEPGKPYFAWPEIALALVAPQHWDQKDLIARLERWTTTSQWAGILSDARDQAGRALAQLTDRNLPTIDEAAVITERISLCEPQAEYNEDTRT